MGRDIFLEKNIKSVSKVLGHLSKPAASTSVPGILRQTLHEQKTHMYFRISAYSRISSICKMIHRTICFVMHDSHLKIMSSASG